MTEFNGNIATQMAFIPGESVREKLVDLLDPFFVDRITQSGLALTFRSVEEYISPAGVTDIRLKNLMRLSEDVTASYPSITYKPLLMPGPDENPTLAGITLEAEFDVSANDEVAQGAELLGFSDGNNRVMARLAIQTQQFAGGRPNGSKGLILQEYVRSSSQYAEIDFVRRNLTE